MSLDMEKLVSYCNSKGFANLSSEIYGGFAAVYDYGPLGVELLNNIKKQWWKSVVYGHKDVYGLDGGIMMHPRTWEASGHVESFADPLFECADCRQRHRSDHLIEDAGYEGDVDALDLEDFNKLRDEMGLKCPSCGSSNLSDARKFNLLVEAEVGVTSKSKVYLRGETCQAIYLNFLNVKRSQRANLPFGIAQIGKSFRNEVTLKNFIFRTREFEQMEMQYFCSAESSEGFYKDWKQERWDYYSKFLGIKEENLCWHEHSDNERAHYAQFAWDIYYKFPMGAKELEGIHHRGTWDLSRHGEFSGTNFEVEVAEGKKEIPTIVETSVGVGRSFLAVLTDAYTEEELEDGDSRVVMKMIPELAPIKMTVMPLVKKDGVGEKADEIYSELAQIGANIDYDQSGSIGKRYRRQDEIGTPYCVTVDYDTLEDGTVTLRHRDSMEQERVSVSGLVDILNKLK